MNVSMTSLTLNTHTAEPLMAFTGVLNTPYTTGSTIPVRAVLNMSLVPSAERNGGVSRYRTTSRVRRENGSPYVLTYFVEVKRIFARYGTIETGL